MYDLWIKYDILIISVAEPEPGRKEPHNLVGVGFGAERDADPASAPALTSPVRQTVLNMV
jgi:hypothetical protein